MAHRPRPRGGTVAAGGAHCEGAGGGPASGGGGGGMVAASSMVSPGSPVRNGGGGGGGGGVVPIQGGAAPPMGDAAGLSGLERPVDGRSPVGLDTGAAGGQHRSTSPRGRWPRPRHRGGRGARQPGCRPCRRQRQPAGADAWPRGQRGRARRWARPRLRARACHGRRRRVTRAGERPSRSAPPRRRWRLRHPPSVRPTRRCRRLAMDGGRVLEGPRPQLRQRHLTEQVGVSTRLRS